MNVASPLGQPRRALQMTTPGYAAHTGTAGTHREPLVAMATDTTGAETPLFRVDRHTSVPTVSSHTQSEQPLLLPRGSSASAGPLNLSATQYEELLSMSARPGATSRTEGPPGAPPPSPQVHHQYEIRDPLPLAMTIGALALQFFSYNWLLCVRCAVCSESADYCESWISRLSRESPCYSSPLGVAAFLIFNVAFGLVTFSFLKCALTDPGIVPRHWGLHVGETGKRRRYCRVCHVWKPDRTHHCSQCGRCVLGMDHHCRLMNSCVGFFNRKFFMQFLVYCLATLSVFAAHSAVTLVVRFPRFARGEPALLAAGRKLSPAPLLAPLQESAEGPSEENGLLRSAKALAVASEFPTTSGGISRYFSGHLLAEAATFFGGAEGDGEGGFRMPSIPNNFRVVYVSLFLTTLLDVGFLCLMWRFTKFHLHLMRNNLTTIDTFDPHLIQRMPFHLGERRNIEVVMGRSCWLWWLPWHLPSSMPSGDGVKWRQRFDKAEER